MWRWAEDPVACAADYQGAKLSGIASQIESITNGQKATWKPYSETTNKPGRTWHDGIASLAMFRPANEIFRQEFKTVRLEVILGIYEYHRSAYQPGWDNLVLILTRHGIPVERPWKYPYDDQ